MNNEPPPPMAQRIKSVLSTKGKLREAIRWRLEVAGQKTSRKLKNKTFILNRFLNNRLHPMGLAIGRRRSHKKTNARLRDMLENQEAASVKQATGLRERIEKLTTSLNGIQADHQKELRKQNLIANKLRIELGALKNLTKGDAVEQLKVSEKLLRTRAERISKYERHLDSLTGFAEFEKLKTPDNFSINGFITKALAQGYHERGRFFLLEELKEKDWSNLLKYFQGKEDGFEALEELRPLFAPWIHYYHGLIDVIQSQGFQVRPLEDYLDNGFQEKSVYMYHDVHAWDIIPALGMLLANKDRGICTTFCLNIDQAYVDIAHEPGYRIFGTLAGKNANLGLHCNPFASWVRMDLFEADEDKFMTWFKSDVALQNLNAFVDNGKTNRGIFTNHTKASAKSAVLERLAKNFTKLKSFYPQARAANHHGDIVNTMYSKLGIVQNKANSFLFVTALLRENLSESIGIEISPTALRKAHKPSGTIYSEIENTSKYFENLHEELGRGLTKQLINHPGAISNGGLVMNLDFVRKLNVKEFEKYLPYHRSAHKPVTPKSVMVELDEND